MVNVKASNIFTAKSIHFSWISPISGFSCEGVENLHTFVPLNSTLMNYDTETHTVAIYIPSLLGITLANLSANGEMENPKWRK